MKLPLAFFLCPTRSSRVCGSLLFAIALPLASASALAQSDAALDRSFDAALAARERGDHEAAVQAFQTILSTNPGLNRVRAELALAYFQSLDLRPAKAETERLLADPSLPIAVRQNLQRLLDAIVQEGRPSVFSPFVSFGYGRDSNINVGPSTDTVQVGGALIPLTPGTLPRTSDYFSLQGGVAHRYLSPYSVKLGGSDATFLWQSQASLYSLDYTGRGGGASDVLAWTLSTGPSLIVPRKWRANLNLQYDDVSVGHSSAAQILGFNPSITWMFGGRTEVTLDGQAQERRFEGANAARNGGYQSLGAAVGHALGIGGIFVQAGHREFRENANAAHFSNSGHDTYAGVGARPWTNGTVFLRFNDKRSAYKGIEPGFTVARDEKEERLVLGVSHLFAVGSLEGWTLGSTITEIRNHSNVSLYTSARTQTAMTLGRRF